LIRQASSALALARGGEAGTIEIFQRDPAGDPLTRLADLESDLHRAIEGDDIAILFQPQLALGSGQITGVEALVRWEHPTLGLLPAETLLGTAATAELAIKLGRHIRARAMREAAGWIGAASRLRLSVNVTAADLADPGFAVALEQARVVSGLPRSRLTLEVTEGAFITDIYGAVELLAALRADGIKIALDDFGTGYSSLAWMARLPIDVIKLDRSFTLGLTGAPRERVVVETMVRLSKQLGMTVIAEGVEDDIQLDAARLAGCDGVQGFRVAPPMAMEPLLGFCDDWQRRRAEL
jgi:EAL domain-containing protein (putative c-di-GMP-specific phosphodiesterase class I)